MTIWLTSLKSDEQHAIEYERCIRQYPCKYDTTPFRQIPDADKKDVMACRLKRHIECVMPEPDEELK